MKENCFKDCFCSKAGFTLIELLVVVLIIGILAAVAVPQYQKAVMKARATEAITNLSKLVQAQKMYYLTNGKYTADLAELDLDFPQGFYKYKCIINNSPDCYASTVDGSWPSFEMTSRALWCRGPAEKCKPFSTAPDTNLADGYWIMETY